LLAAATACCITVSRAGYKVPTLTSNAPEIEAKTDASSSATIIAGAAPMASNTFAVISCTTSLVSRCTSGLVARRRASSSAMIETGSVLTMVGQSS